LPMSLCILINAFTAYFEQGCAKVVSFSPFFIIGLAFIIGISPVVYVVLLLGGMFSGLRCPWIGVTKNNLKFGFIESFNVLKMVDQGTAEVAFGMQLLCCYKTQVFNANGTTTAAADVEAARASSRRDASERATEERAAGIDVNQPAYFWDLFVPKCINATTHLLSKEWITKDDVESVAPSVVLIIPAVAALNILVDSVKNDDGKQKDVIFWGDGIVCTSKTRPRNDNVVNLLWPMVMDIKKILKQNVDLIKDENIAILFALICSQQNSEDQTAQLKAYLTKTTEDSAANKNIRSKLMDLALSLSRVKPMTERLSQIISHDY